jgi:quinol monooxygenase YgiN
MYGTLARARVKPGKADEVARLFEEMGRPEGSIAVSVLRTDADPDQLFIGGVFESREAYQRNAASPEQDARFRRLRELLVADPEWHDGEVIFARHRAEVETKA